MSAIGLSVGTFGLLLCVLVGLSLFVEGRFMLRVALALLGNWAAHIVWWTITADPTPYLFSLVADVLTAVVVLIRPAGRMQALIGWSLLVQITIHSAYIYHLLVGGYAVEAEVKYWEWLDRIALVQIALAGGWTIGGVGRRIFGGHAHRGRHRARAVDPAGVAQP
jgi:hypothetical protein